MVNRVTHYSFLLFTFLIMKYGWEIPSQIFVIMICFTYAVICPVILPFGALYFGFSLIVYKKQILYVYQPVYESGGAMFPGSLQKTLLSLALGQITFIGYLFTRVSVSYFLLSFVLLFIYTHSIGDFNIVINRSSYLSFSDRFISRLISRAFACCHVLGNEVL